MRNTIAVIGGGTSALYLLRAFVYQANREDSLTIFESGERFGVGMPYSPEWSNPEHELNIASQELPELYEESHDWLRRQSDELLSQWGISKSEIGPLSILPRILFGIYQEEQFHVLVRVGRSRGLNIHLLANSTVTHIEDDSNRNIVRLMVNNQETFEYKQVIIATGHQWPTELEEKIQGYFDSPFPLRKITSITNTRVGIIGTSLSAVDAIRTLARNNGYFYENENGELIYQINPSYENFSVVMHSRRGLMPSIRYHLEHPRIRRYEYISKNEIERNIYENNGFLSLDYVFEASYMETVKKNDPQTFAEIQNMKIEQFVEYYYQREGINSSEPFAFLTEQLKINRRTEQEKNPIYWKEAIEDTVYTLNFHASALSAEDTIRLRTYLMPLYYHAVIFMPYDSTVELLALHQAGYLEIVTLGFQSEVITNHNKDGAVFKFIDAFGEERQLHYDIVVDCRGQRQMPFESFPFRNLAEQGTVAPARIRFASIDNADQQSTVPENCSIEFLNGVANLRLPGVAINQKFQVMNMKNETNSRIYIVANAHIKGMNPDLSGIPFCNDSARVVMNTIFT